MSPLSRLPEANACRQPDECALVFGDQRCTFGRHAAQSRLLTNALAASGLRRQDRIAVMSRNNPAYLEIYSAAQRSGLVVATVNFRLAPPEVAHILNDAAPVALFFEIEYAGIIDSLRSTLPTIGVYVCLDGEPDGAISYPRYLESGVDRNGAFHADNDDLLHLIFTSGTTGRPKGVMRSHAAEFEMANLMTSEVGVMQADVVQIMMPLFHVGARWLQLGAQLRGARVVLHRDFDPLEVLKTIEGERVTITHMAPTIVQRVLDHPAIDNFDLSSLKTIYYSAAPMPVQLLRRGMARLGPVFLQAYGMTEGYGTTLHKHQHLPDGDARQVKRLQSVGQAGAGVLLRVVDGAGVDLPVGMPGEVLIHTGTRLSGYWNNSVATAAALRDGWYASGDIGYLDEQGYLFLVDRKKDMIISGGENIYCREVEEAVAAHPDVADVAVIGVPDAQWGESVHAVVVCKAGAVLGLDDIVDFCRPLIAGYKRPRSVRFVDELPRLNTGKVDKVRLRAEAANALPRA